MNTIISSEIRMVRLGWRAIAIPVIAPSTTEIIATSTATLKLTETECLSVSSSHAAEYHDVVAPVNVDDCRPTTPRLNE